MLGEAGATVYCTGRSSRAQPNVSSHVNAGRPETIEETAEMVTADGGTGIPVRVDHTMEDQVVALFERVGREQGRLDVLAIAMTGQPASWKNFLEETPARGKAFVDGWIWPHVMTAWHGAKLMVQRRAGLIVELVEQDNVGYHGAFYFDLMETLLKRLVLGLAQDLGKSGLTAVAIAPGSCGQRRFWKGLASPRRVGVMPSAIHTPLPWAGADPRHHASSAVRWPHLRQTPRSHERMAVSTQPGPFRKNTGSTTSMVSVPTTPCSTRRSSRPRRRSWPRRSTPAGSYKWTGSWLGSRRRGQAGRQDVRREDITLELSMRFVIAERFRGGDRVSVYRRFRDRGRLAPEGLRYINSWVSRDLTTCYQVMECDDRRLLDQWIANWSDIVEFEVIPALTSAEAAAAVAPRL